MNVVDTEKAFREAIEARKEAGTVREQLGCGNRLMVLFVGTMTDQKRVDRLLHAYATLKEYHASSLLVLVGDGPSRAASEQLARELSIASQAIFLGDIFDGVARYFEAADLVVVPGTGGLVISEAMVHGKPVVSSVGDGVERDLIVPGLNGELVGPDSAEELATAIGRCLSEPDRLKMMGEASRKRIQEGCNIEAYINELVAGVVTAHQTVTNR